MRAANPNVGHAFVDIAPHLRNRGPIGLSALVSENGGGPWPPRIRAKIRDARIRVPVSPFVLTELANLLAASGRVAGVLDSAVLAQRAAHERRSLVGTAIAIIAILEDPGCSSCAARRARVRRPSKHC